LSQERELEQAAEAAEEEQEEIELLFLEELN